MGFWSDVPEQSGGVIIHHLGGTRVVAGCVIVVGEYANAEEGRVGPAPKYSVIVYASGPARTRHHSTGCECPPQSKKWGMTFNFAKTTGGAVCRRCSVAMVDQGVARRCKAAACVLCAARDEMAHNTQAEISANSALAQSRTC